MPLRLVERNVGLRDDRLQTVRGEFLLAERAREETAAVFAALDVDDEGAFKLRRVKIILRTVAQYRSLWQ